MKTNIITLTLPAMFLLWGTVGLNAQSRSDYNNARSSSPSRSSNAVSNPSQNSNTSGGRGASLSTPTPAVKTDNNTTRGGNNNANNGRRGSFGDNNRQPVVVRGGNREVKHYPRENTVIVTNRPERRITEIHEDYRRVSYRGIDYSYDNGRYYRVNNGAYIVTTPPRGIRVSLIPNGFLTLMVGTLPYYYYGGVYYREIATDNYEVVDPPMGAIVPELPADDVRAVVIGGKTYFEYDNILYKTVVTSSGVQYKVIGTLDDVQR
ncbi:MAG: DUF6515 family protein [Paludibacteraceae bacterium]|nr:DUF6515 family protein [Paludibacteraceae bacterium]